MFTVQQAGINELGLIQQIARATWPSAYGSIISAEQVEYMLGLMYSTEALKAQLEQGHQFLLGINDGKPSGFVSYSAINPRRYRIHKLYVLPNLQGTGCGKYLLHQVITDISKHNAGFLELNVNRENPAISFYKKMGFIILREEDINIGNGYFMNDYVMQLALKPG